jgi:ankyrin repeat protein
MKAAATDDAAEVARLIAAGAAVDEVTPHDPESLFFEGGRTALMTAAWTGSLAAARALIDAGADLGAVADDGDTVASCAAMSGNIAVVELVLDRGAPWAPPDAKFTPLYHAAARGDVALIERLLARGAAVDEPIWTGTTPLAAAARGGWPAAVEVLLRHGARPDTPDRAGRTPLIEIVSSDLGDVELLMRRDEAALARLREVTRQLVLAGADVRLRDGDGLAALDHAADRYLDLLDVVRLLVEAGAEVGARDATGATPLVRACRKHATLVAAYLLERGADPSVRDADGEAALDHARANDYADLVQLLAEHAGGAPGGGLQPPASSARAIADAAASFTAGRYADALASYRWVPAPLRERVPEIASNMGYCFQQLGDTKEARRHLMLALDRKPELTQAARAACYACWQEEAWEDMLRFAQHAVRGAPKDSYGWQQLAIAHAALEQHAKAVTAGTKAVELDPSNGYATCNLALALSKVGDPAWVPTLARAVALAPELAEVDDVATAMADPAYAAAPRAVAKPGKAKPAKAKPAKAKPAKAKPAKAKPAKAKATPRARKR